MLGLNEKEAKLAVFWGKIYLGYHEALANQGCGTAHVPLTLPGASNSRHWIIYGIDGW